MSLTLVSTAGKFDPYTRDSAPMYNVMAKAVLGVGSLAEKLTAQNMLLRDDCSADFVVSALQAGSAAADTICDLVTLGVTFPANTIRPIFIDAFCSGDGASTEKLYERLVGSFLGGTTPTNMVVKVIATAADATGLIYHNTAAASWTTSDPAVSFGTTGSGSVPVTVTNEGAAESNFWVLRIKVGKLIPVRLGV